MCIYGQRDSILLMSKLQKLLDMMLTDVVRRNVSWMDLVEQRKREDEKYTSNYCLHQGT